MVEQDFQASMKDAEEEIDAITNKPNQADSSNSPKLS
jgi:hypothetical protein